MREASEEVNGGAVKTQVGDCVRRETLEIRWREVDENE